MWAGWVGDQDPTFDGLQYVAMAAWYLLRLTLSSLRDALANMFHSAWQNYTNFGSDIGTGTSPA